MTPRLILSLVLALLLLPFSNKAFHIDDPLFLWTAKQILADPFHFYDFHVNWYTRIMPMHEVIQNPPLISYYMAPVGAFCGFGEVPLHLSFFLLSILCALGIFELAKELCPRPLLATLISITSPLFLLSGTTLMSDIPMLNFWVWAVVFWMRGLKKDRPAFLIISALLASLCTLTKYPGISVVPLLVILSLGYRKKAEKWILLLIIPILSILFYEWLTCMLYGHGHFLGAANYAIKSRSSGSNPLIINAIVGLAFTGGCILNTLFFAPFMWTKTALKRWALFGAFMVAGLCLKETYHGLQFVERDSIHWWTILQASFYLTAGLHLFVLSLFNLWNRRSTDSLMIFLWIMGTYLFASQVNWTINGRSIIPMTPVAGILVANMMPQTLSISWSPKRWKVLIPFALAAILSLSVTWADYRMAESGRKAASIITYRYRNYPQSVWFQGHWGFQYYMEEPRVFRPFDVDNIRFSQGDLIIIPFRYKGGNNFYFTTEAPWAQIDEIEVEVCHWVSVHDCSVRTGFYSAICGPVPYLFKSAETDRYRIFRMKRDVHIPSSALRVLSPQEMMLYHGKEG